MNRPPQNSNPPRKHYPEPDMPETEHDSLAYLEEGAIVPPPKPKTFPRTSSRRGFVAGGLVTIGATAWFGVPLNTEGAFFPGTMVNDLDIAELNRGQAMALMRSHYADFENTAVDFTFEQNTWNASLAQLGFAINYEATLDMAWSHGRESSRLEQFTGVMIRTEKRSFPVVFTRDDDQLNAYLQDIATRIVGAARDARLYLDDDMVRIQPNEDGRTLDIETAANVTRQAVQSAERATVKLAAQSVVSQITAETLEPKRQLAQIMINAPVRIDTGDEMWAISQSTLRAALLLPEPGVLADPVFDEQIIGQSLAEMKEAVHTLPKDAVLGWDSSLVVVTPDTQGRELDMAGTVQAVTSVARTPTERTIDALFQDIVATVRADELDSLGIIDFIAGGDSNFDGSSWERAENVRISADHLTHTLVKPGDTYSFNQAIGPITLENGFVEGKIIRGSWIVSDIGGGACQASTTVFRAALEAGLPIDHNYHQYRLQFYELDGMPPGLDAAIYQPNNPGDGEEDLTFVNITDNWLLVEFYTEGVHAYCNIYGTPPGWDVDIEVPYIGDAQKPDPPVETEDPKLAKGEREQVGWATDGYDVMARRTIRQNGQPVEFESMVNPWEFWSYFLPQRDEYLIGPGTKRQFDKDGETTPTPSPEG